MKRARRDFENPPARAAADGVKDDRRRDWQLMPQKSRREKREEGGELELTGSRGKEKLNLKRRGRLLAGEEAEEEEEGEGGKRRRNRAWAGLRKKRKKEKKGGERRPAAGPDQENKKGWKK